MTRGFRLAFAPRAQNGTNALGAQAYRRATWAAPEQAFFPERHVGGTA